MPDNRASQRRENAIDSTRFDRVHACMQACAADSILLSSKPPEVNTPKPEPTDEAVPLPDFERSLAELEAIVEKLEQGELSLEDSLRQFERGVQLTRTCQAALKEAEQKVEILLRKSGSPEQFDTAEFDPDESEEG